MIGEKVEQFQGKGANLEVLPGKIAEYLQSEGFTVQRSETSAHGTAIQAKKGGILAGLIASDRALSIVISGTPDDFTVRIGIGKWAEHLVTAAVETLLLSELFLVVDVAEMAWTIEIENKLLGQIRSFVG
jgi:hypothetical protein